MTITDWSTNVSEVEVTAHVSCDIHPSPVKSGDIASFDRHCLILKAGGG